MSRIVINDLHNTTSLNDVEMSATRGGAPREESGKYGNTANSKPTFYAGYKHGLGPWDVRFTDDSEGDELGTMAANTANMGVITGSN